MEAIVQNYYGEERAGTFFISQGFRKEHRRLIELINSYKQDFLDLEEDNNAGLNGLITNKVPTKKAGRPVEEYMLNEMQTLFLGSLFRNSDVVVQFKKRIAQEFVKLKRQNIALKEKLKEPVRQLARAKGILIRNQETDIIDEFVKYAIEQGSTNSKWYFKNITSMMNGVLFIVEGKYSNLKLVMSTEQLMTTASAEQIIKKTLIDSMEQGIFYKEIYKKIKKNIYLFAEMHGQSNIIDQQLTLDGF